jgi:hypothetical protein
MEQYICRLNPEYIARVRAFVGRLDRLLFGYRDKAAIRAIKIDSECRSSVSTVSQHRKCSRLILTAALRI